MSIKIIVMGVGGVGKSAITNRFVVGRWIEKYDPTIEESYQATVDIDGKALQVEILDTAGQDEYTPLRETFMHTGDGFMLVYSITDDQTLEELRSIREQILRVHRNKKIPMVVIGNKVDMAKKDRAVSKEEGKALAEEFGAKFLEVSAKENSKVKDAFELLIKTVISKNPKAGKESSKDAAPSGVFGDGKGDPADDASSSKGSKKSKKTSAKKTGLSREAEPTDKKGKCAIL
jgi:small GTP-binding protein